MVDRPLDRAGTTSSSRIDLGAGLVLVYTFASSTELDWALLWESTEFAQGSVSVGAPSGPTPVATDFVRGELEVAIEPFSGAVSATAELSVREPATEPPVWKTVINRTDPNVVLIDPTKGEVAGSASTEAPIVVGFGPNGPSGDGVTRFHISDDVRMLADVGRIVKEQLFADTPPLTLNIVACCGRPVGAADGPGTYGDPESPWFNVFFGIYQMDCAKADGWTRPFAYERAAGVNSTVHGEDLARVGTADWNWFSNYLYGVPRHVCEQYSHIDMSKVTFSPIVTETHGTSQWHRLTMSGVVVASAYESSAPGAERLVTNSALTPTWQSSFGLPCPRPGYSTSFIPTTLRSTLLMAYVEDDHGFHTLMFGGTAAVTTDASFLDAQVAAVTKTIVDRYPAAGFAS
jgi:hypothetical protein